MFTHRANGFDGGSQGFSHAGGRHRTSYLSNTLSLSAQSPVEQLGSEVQIRMYSANPENGYHGSPRQADQQDHPSRHNGQSYGQVGGPYEGHRFVGREFQGYQDESHTPLGNKGPFLPLAESYTMYESVPALQFSDGRGPPAQFGRPAYEGRSADRAVPDDVQGMRNNILLPLSSPGRNSGLKSPNQQHLTASTPSSSPPARDAQQSPAIRNSTSPSQALLESCSCPYPHCNREFRGSSRKGNMSRHIRTKHGAPGSGARKYRCSGQGCGKEFMRNDAKLNHERKEHPELGHPPAAPRKMSNQAATCNPGMSTPQK